MFILIVIKMKTFAILSSCAALFLSPLASDAQLRRTGAPGIPAAGNLATGMLMILVLTQLEIQLAHPASQPLGRV